MRYATAESSFIPKVLNLSIETLMLERQNLRIIEFPFIKISGSLFAGINNATLIVYLPSRSRVQSPSTGPALKGKSMFFPSTLYRVKEYIVLEGLA